MAEELVLTGSTSREYGRAALVVVAVLFFYALLLLTDLPAVLPGYPAVIVSFLIWCVVPGWFLQRWLFATDGTGLAEQAAVAFLMSMAAAAVPGLLALRFHWSVEAFGLAYATLAIALSLAAFVFLPARLTRERTPEEGDGAFPVLPLLVIIGVPLLAVLTSPWWAGDRLARDADDLIYISFVVEYQNNDLDAAAPLQDVGRGAFGRMQFNVWVVVQALLAETSGVTAMDLLLDYIPPIMTLLVLLAMFTMARGLFSNVSVGLLACAFVLLYGALDLAPHEGYGRNIFLRIGEDKMVASYILLPLGLLLLTRLTASQHPQTYLAMLMSVAALFVVHPMALMFLGLATAALVGVRMLTERSIQAVRSSAWLLAPWAVVWGGLYLSKEFGSGGGPLIEGSFRRGFHVVDVLGAMLIGSHHLILHPFMLAAIVLVVPLWLLRRCQVASQLLLACVAVTLAITFIPALAKPVAEAVNEEAVWRLHWLIPVPLILAYALHRLLLRFPAGDHWWGGPIAKTGMLPAIAIVLIASVAFLLQEHYLYADDGAYYNRTSDTALLPWTDGSIALGGVERAFSSDWRPSPTEAALLKFLDEHAPPRATVMMPPSISDRFFPGVLGDVRSVNFLGAPQPAVREVFIEAYYNGTFDELELGRDVETLLDDLSVDFVVVPPRTELDDDARRFVKFDAADFVVELGEPELIAFRDPAGDEFSAWAFDGQDEERVGGVEFTVPVDMNPSRPVLEFVIELAAAADVAEETSARIIVTYFEARVRETTSVVTDVVLSGGLLEGERIILRRPIAPTVEAGKTYRFIISRLPNTPDDRLDQDIWLTGLSVKYWPQSFVPIGNSGFFVYER